MYSHRKKIIFIFGTRPEAIKLAPVINIFFKHINVFETIVVTTAQHREMLDQVLDLFAITPKYDLNIMTHDQTLSEITAKALQGIDRILRQENPDLVFVQGDTTTTFVGALAAFYHRTPVAHVEAGLRTYDRYHPYPEEINRVMTSSLAALHFAPTEQSKANLLRGNVSPSRVFVTGNTVIDALLDVAARKYTFNGTLAKIFGHNNTRKLLVTAHRRENHGGPIKAICRAVLEIVEGFNDVEIVFPVHLSPKVRDTVFALLESHSRIHLVPPLDYQAFINAMKESYLILTDSGGVQEEAPSLGKPVLVLREATERPEAVEAETVRLVGTDLERIVTETSTLLNDQAAYQSMARAINPYGDGLASERIMNIVERFL
jgi:UDP-N-acetylglucosamine 2-epimerase (non-hydrolysing)